ncbi:MAG: glycosyltransferase family 39 protein [Candidatus Shapirobacteria bacterium]|nr:glycosyltransferase family 39 protein [Candidatus Shapirobacteria bacterium]
MSFKKKLLKNKWLILIILIAAILRFAFYQDRLVLNQDQCRDAVIALYANRTSFFPPIGPPSSAGPFNFGPWYYYFVMFFSKVIPFSAGPWIGFTLMSIISVFLYAKIGEIISGKKGMIITGLIAAFSPALVNSSSDMLNTVIIGFSSALVLFFTAKFFKEEKIVWIILLSFFIGISINFHFQSLGLLSFLLLIVLINNFSLFKRIKLAFFAFIGLFISFLPIIYFDINRNLVWIKSLIEYYTVGVKKFYVPVRWLTELRDFWPKLFGYVTTGIPNIGYLWLILGLITLFIILKKKEKIDNFWLTIVFSLLIQVFLLRYYKGPRSNEYLIAFYGSIILISSWILINIYSFKKSVGVILLSLIIILASSFAFKQIKQNPSQAKTIFSIKKELESQIKENINIFGYKNSNMVSLPIFYLFYYQNRIDDNGQPFAFCDNNRFVCPTGQFMTKDNYLIYKLDEIKDKTDFNQITPENIYQILMVNYGN